MVAVRADLAGVVRLGSSGVPLDFGDGFPSGSGRECESEVFAFRFPLCALGIHVPNREAERIQNLSDCFDEFVTVSPDGSPHLLLVGDPRRGNQFARDSFLFDLKISDRARDLGDPRS